MKKVLNIDTLSYHLLHIVHHLLASNSSYYPANPRVPLIWNSRIDPFQCSLQECLRYLKLLGYWLSLPPQLNFMYLRMFKINTTLTDAFPGKKVIVYFVHHMTSTLVIDFIFRWLHYSQRISRFLICNISNDKYLQT